MTASRDSLPRNEALSELLVRREAGKSFDKGQFEATPSIRLSAR
jgi:hypothetical protein